MAIKELLHDRSQAPPHFAFFIDLSLPYGLRSQSSAEIANGVTRGEKRNTGAAIPRLPRGNELSQLLPLLEAKSIVGSLHSPVTVAFSFYTLRDIDFHSPLHISFLELSGIQ